MFVSSHRTKSAFDSKMQKASKSTDFRVPLSVCTMFNVLMDAKKQCSKLCVLDTGQEVSQRWFVQWKRTFKNIQILVEKRLHFTIFLSKPIFS